MNIADNLSRTIAFISGAAALSIGLTVPMVALTNISEPLESKQSETQSLENIPELPTPIQIPDLPPLDGEVDLPPHQFLTEGLRERARRITVKVLLEDSWGSGIIIKRQGQLYTVVTNDHVLRHEKDEYRIQTPDGLIHQAWRSQGINFNNYDLGLLQFSTADGDYEAANLGSSSTLSEGDKVVAAGFPFAADQSQDAGFKFTEGRVSLLPEKSLEEGYQVGYTNNIEKGMSGGPVLNLEGAVVAINGMHAYPLWGDPYVYQDGQKPCPPMREIMERSSWAIPIDTFLQLAPQFSTSNVTQTLTPTKSQSVTDSSGLMQKQAEAAKNCNPLPTQ
ncbi:MAG: serine protease [Xenococcaceae cyanobacterium]